MRLIYRVGIIVTACLLPVIAVEIYNSVAIQKAREIETEQAALQQAEYASSELDRIFEGMRGVMTALGQAPAVRALDTELCNPFVEQLQKELKYVSTLIVVDTNGEVKCAPSPEQASINSEDRQKLQPLLKSNSFVVGDYLGSQSDGPPTLPLAAPILDATGKQIGTVLSTLNLSWLSAQLLKRGVLDGGSITVADRDGTILARQPDPLKFVGTKIPDAFRHLLFEVSPGVTSVMSQDGTARVLGYLPLKNGPHGLYISAGLSEQKSYLHRNVAAWRQAFVTLLALLGSILGGYLLTRHYVARPFERLMGTIQIWQTGNLKARTGLNPDQGEIGSLGNEFDRTMDQLLGRQEAVGILLRELAHRSKNQISLLISLINQIAKSKHSVDEFKQSIVDRLMAMSMSQDLLLRTPNEPLTLGDLVQAYLEAFETEESDRIKLSGPDFFIAPEKARYLGMAIHELSTNAAKYGALSNGTGYVDISWRLVGGANQEVEFIWTERQGPSVVHPESTGFGRTLIEKIVPLQMNGKCQLIFNISGLVWKIRFPAQ